MSPERKPEQFEDDRKKWNIYFDSDSEKISQNNEGYISVIFRTNRKNNLNISEEDLTKLKQDIRDLGKFRIIKEGRRFLKE